MSDLYYHSFPWKKSETEFGLLILGMVKEKNGIKKAFFVHFSGLF